MLLFQAVLCGHEAVAKLLLDTGEVDGDLKDNNGQTPVMVAAENGDVAIFKLLLDTGSEVEIESRGGWTPLQLAVFNGHERVEQLLVIHGSSEPEDFYGFKQLFLVR